MKIIYGVHAMCSAEFRNRVFICSYSELANNAVELAKVLEDNTHFVLQTGVISAFRRKYLINDQSPEVNAIREKVIKDTGKWIVDSLLNLEPGSFQKEIEFKNTFDLDGEPINIEIEISVEGFIDEKSNSFVTPNFKII